jgi:hypothetical protein
MNFDQTPKILNWAIISTIMDTFGKPFILNFQLESVLRALSYELNIWGWLSEKTPPTGRVVNNYIAGTYHPTPSLFYPRLLDLSPCWCFSTNKLRISFRRTGTGSQKLANNLYLSREN